MRILLRNPSRTQDVLVTGDPIGFHRRLPGYRPSPLVDLGSIAERLGVARVYAKSETSRFGLPSFKVLGASWATFSVLCERLGPLPAGDLSHEQLRAWVAPLKPLTLIAATDGNHGRAVARVARWLGVDAQIFVPSFVSPERCRAIVQEGADLVVVDGVYDAAVDAAARAAGRERTLLVSDTARSPDDLMPKLVMQGYSTVFAEIDAQLRAKRERPIDIVAIQAGVGGLASSCATWAAGRKGHSETRVMVVEPGSAACVMAGLAAGEPVTVTGSDGAISNMACLQCGTVSQTAFPGLSAGVNACLAIEDHWADRAVDALGSAGLSTQPSGAAGFAGLLAALEGPHASALRDHLELTRDSRVLVVATEAAANAVQPKTEEPAYA